MPASARARTLAFTYVNDDLKDRVVKLAADFGNRAGAALRRDERRPDRCAVRRARARVGRRSTACCIRSRSRRARRSPATTSTACRAQAFAIAHDISSYSFAALAKGARPLMQGRHGALLTLTYLGAVRAMPNYNVMGLAKASLEANVRYLAQASVRRASASTRISAGPIKTLAAAGIGGFSKHPAFRREDRAAAPQRHHRRSRQRRRVSSFRPCQRDHRRDHLRRLRILDRRRGHGRGVSASRARCPTRSRLRGAKRAVPANAHPRANPSRMRPRRA